MRKEYLNIFCIIPEIENYLEKIQIVDDRYFKEILINTKKTLLSGNLFVSYEYIEKLEKVINANANRGDVRVISVADILQVLVQATLCPTEDKINELEIAVSLWIS